MINHDLKCICFICVKHEEKTVKEVEMHKFSVCAYKSPDFVQGHTFFHSHTTVRR